MQRRQGTNEPVSDYSQAVKVLARGAWPGMDSITRSSLACKFFVNGLLPKLRRRVMGKSPANLECAIELAEKEEAQNRLLATEGLTTANISNHREAEITAITSAVRSLAETQQEILQNLNKNDKKVRFSSPGYMVAAVDNGSKGSHPDLHAEIEPTT